MKQTLRFSLGLYATVFQNEVYAIKACKSVPITRPTCHGGASKERRYSSYSFLTSDLEVGKKSASCPGGTLSPEKKSQVPIAQEGGWATELVWMQMLEEKSSAAVWD
jgi:hypothetical protein